MLGGQNQLSDYLSTDKNIPLTLNSGHSTSHSIMSFQTAANNMLLRITTPKRIGKRKRGSNEPFTPIDQAHPVMRNTQYLLRSLNDNEHQTTIEAVGKVQKSHVWRTLPDFEYSAQGSSFLADIQSKLLPKEYTKLKDWQLPRTFGLTDTDIAPPPTFTTMSLPQTYSYHQPKVDKVLTVEPSQSWKKPKHFVIRCSNLEPFPLAPPPDAPSLRSQSATRRDLVTNLQALFTKRPLWTRRALTNQMPGGRISDECNLAISYVAFFIAKGPWSNTYCAFGKDPRIDSQYRIYQTMLVTHDQRDEQQEVEHDALAEPEREVTEEMNARSHIFSGRGPIVGEGSIFQLCDLEDPQLKRLVEVDESQISSECDRHDFGWYGNGTLTKIRIMLRLKLNALRNGNPIPDEVFEPMITYHERVAVGTHAQQRDTAPVPDSASSLERALARAYREGCRNQGRSKVKLVGQTLENEDGSYTDDEDYETDGILGSNAESAPSPFQPTLETE